MCDCLGAVDLPSIDEVLADPAASFWLKTALSSALGRDPVDAAHDSEILAQRLGQRRDAMENLRQMGFARFLAPLSDPPKG